MNKNTNFADIYSLNNSLKDLIEQNTIVETESEFLEKISLNLKFVNKSELEIYEQSVSLEEGIKETIDWYRNEKI